MASFQSQLTDPVPRCVVIVGGGLAGVAAAVRLADYGVKVTLVETRKRLGGRATSFVDPATGQILDNCQHVLLKCCTSLLDLYRRLGVTDHIEWHRTMYFQSPDLPDGEYDVLTADDLPAPVHMSRAILAFRSLTWPEKIAISRAMAEIMWMGKKGREKLYDISFAQWLSQQNQPAGAIEKFWSVVVISAINELPDRMAAAYAIQVFQEGFLNHEDAYVMGLSKVPLVALYDAAEAVLAKAGGGVMLSTSAEGFEFADGLVTGLRIDGGRTLTGDAYISAVPFDRVLKLVTPAMRQADTRFDGLDRIGVSPIIGIHLYLHATRDQPAMALPHLVLMKSPIQWVFNKGVEPLPADARRSRLPGDVTHVQHLHGVVSAAHAMVDWPAERIVDLMAREVMTAIPEVRGRLVVHSRVVKEKRATYSAGPGFERLRPDSRGAIKNLLLAGDWVRSGWPATMEGATRSGYLAAESLLHPYDNPWDRLPAPLPASPMYRLISGL